jgi:hypothetical protein
LRYEKARKTKFAIGLIRMEVDIGSLLLQQTLPPVNPLEESSAENRPAKVTKRKSSTKLSKPGTPDPVSGRKHVDIQVSLDTSF